MNGDVIRLRIPYAKPFHGVARLVVGGLAARLDFSYEHLEDLQLALASVLEDGYGADEHVVVELRLREDGVQMAVGPLEGRRLRADLARESEDVVGLGRLLATVAERVEVDERSGQAWLRLEKRVVRTGA